MTLADCQRHKMWPDKMAYEDFSAEELILRDRLALDRTHLANERTLLAYVRTAFMLIVGGATAIKALPDDRVAVISGWILLAIGVLVAVVGAGRFQIFRRRVERDARALIKADEGIA
jgi:putative membrane protein